MRFVGNSPLFATAIANRPRIGKVTAMVRVAHFLTHDVKVAYSADLIS